MINKNLEDNLEILVKIRQNDIFMKVIFFI